MAVENPDFELAMKFTDSAGNDIRKGESAMQVDPKDNFMNKDFKAINNYDEFSNFFEVQSFDFSLRVEPADAGGKKHVHLGGRGPTVAPGRAGAHQPPGAALRGPGAEDTDSFRRWRSAKQDEAEKMRWHADMEEFSFTRLIDGVSPIFFEGCAKKHNFKTAILVKRVSVGTTALPGRTRIAQAFLRLDFERVQIKSVKWNDGDLITETCVFTCHKFTFKYKQQQANGELLEAVTSQWEREAAAERQREGIQV